MADRSAWKEEAPLGSIPVPVDEEGGEEWEEEWDEEEEEDWDDEDEFDDDDSDEEEWEDGDDDVADRRPSRPG